MNLPLRKAAPYIFYGPDHLALRGLPRPGAGEDRHRGRRRLLPSSAASGTACRRRWYSTDAAYFRLTRDYIKPGDRPLQVQSRTEFGRPYDCGLCPDHEQHTCLRADRRQRGVQPHLPGLLLQFEPRAHAAPVARRDPDFMLDALVASEGVPDLIKFPAASRPSTQKFSTSSRSPRRSRSATSCSTPTASGSRASRISPRHSRSSSRASRSISNSIRSGPPR